MTIDALAKLEITDLEEILLADGTLAQDRRLILDELLARAFLAGRKSR